MPLGRIDVVLTVVLSCFRVVLPVSSSSLEGWFAWAGGGGGGGGGWRSDLTGSAADGRSAAWGIWSHRHRPPEVGSPGKCEHTA